MHLWQEQSRQYHMELQDLHKRSKKTIEGLKQGHSMLSTDMEAAAARLNRVEQNVDFVESQTSPRACANQADRVLEQGVWSQEESRGEEEEEWEELPSRVTGEIRPLWTQNCLVQRQTCSRMTLVNSRF